MLGLLGPRGSGWSSGWSFLDPEGVALKGRKHTVKKLIVLAVVALGLAAVWRKVQADRAELDLWTEATSADE